MIIKAKVRKEAGEKVKDKPKKIPILYMMIRGRKHYIRKEFIEKYHLEGGQITPFTGLLIQAEKER